jgi:hypothetical protein
MLRDATHAWNQEHTSTPEPFTGLTCHDLRHTAASLMRQAGMPAELVAERLGHADGGALLLRTYRHVRVGETRVALDAIGPALRAAALLTTKRNWVRPSATPAAPNHHGAATRGRNVDDASRLPRRKPAARACRKPAVRAWFREWAVLGSNQ